jgi:hypothetical protein
MTASSPDTTIFTAGSANTVIVTAGWPNGITVMAGLVPAIPTGTVLRRMAGSSPAMTT